MCWAHVMMKVKDRLDASDPNYEAIKNDIRLIQLSRNKNCFDLGFKLLKSKWKSKFADFLEYFEKEWINKHSGWFEGFAPGIPSTNNSVEGSNKWLKRSVTEYERLPFGRFMFVFEKELLKEWSKERKPGVPYEKVFKTEPTITNDDWEKAFNLSIEKRSMTKFVKNKKTYFAIASNDKPIVADFENEVKTFLEEIEDPKWKTFKQYQTNLFRMSIIEFNKDNWKLSTCTCPPYSKQYKCKHIIYFAVKNNLCVFPAAAKAIEITSKSSNGRIAKAKPALQRQDDSVNPSKKRKI